MAKIVGIRIVNAEKIDTGTLLEQLRYAGAMGRYPRFNSTAPVELLYVPSGISNKSNWAEQNIARMASFGIKAEVVKD